MKLIAYIVYGVSQTLYKLFGINTPLRKDWLKEEANKLQDELNNQHYTKYYINAKFNTNYTTKVAIELAIVNGIITTDEYINGSFKDFIKKKVKLIIKK